jgi:hypothetical protein
VCSLNIYNNIDIFSDNPKINLAIFLDLSNLLKNDAELNGASFVIIYITYSGICFNSPICHTSQAFRNALGA